MMSFSLIIAMRQKFTHFNIKQYKICIIDYIIRLKTWNYSKGIKHIDTRDEERNKMYICTHDM